MRRLFAAGIDFMISYILSIIFYCLIISIWKMVRIIQGTDMKEHSILIIIIIFFISMITTNFTYSVFFDKLFSGYTPGKKILFYYINAGAGGNIIRRKWVIKHALLRTIASLFYPITAIYYIITLRMPYDKIIGVTPEKKFDNEYFEKVIDKEMCKKRLIATIIDYFIILIMNTFIIFIYLYFNKNQIDALHNVLINTIYFTCFLLFIYFFIMDYFCKGSSIGKKLTGIIILADMKKFNITAAFKHSVLKTIACSIWPVSILYYFLKGAMFYDKWLNLQISKQGES